jgi:hypothetical protein
MWELADTAGEFRVCDSKRTFLFIFEAVEQRRKQRRDLALTESGGFIEGYCCAFKLSEFFEFETVTGNVRERYIFEKLMVGSLHVADVLGRVQLVGQIAASQQLFVGGFEQRITCTSLCEHKKRRHGGLLCETEGGRPQWTSALRFVGVDFRSLQILKILGANAKISTGAWAKDSRHSVWLSEQNDVKSLGVGLSALRWRPLRNKIFEKPQLAGSDPQLQHPKRLARRTHL